MSTWDDVQWKINFRVSKPTFEYFCNKLRPSLQHSDCVRASIPVQTKVASYCTTELCLAYLLWVLPLLVSLYVQFVMQLCELYSTPGSDAIAIVQGFRE